MGPILGRHGGPVMYAAWEREVDANKMIRGDIEEKI